MIQGAIIGVIVAIVMMIYYRRQATSGTGLAGQLEQQLGARGPLTLKEAADTVGKGSFFGRGEVANALGALVSVGKARVIPAPEGTPQLKKVDFIRYELVAPREFSQS